MKLQLPVRCRRSEAPADNALALGRDAMHRGYHSVALHHFDEALGCEPNRADIRAMRAVALAKNSQLAEARREAQAVINTHPHLGVGYYALAEASRRLGNIDDALAQAAAGIRLGCPEPDIHCVRAFCLLDQKNSAAAYGALQDGLTAFPGNERLRMAHDLLCCRLRL
jgi:predicted Zn-dependent protease